jgi:hypothetical protein
MLIFELTAIDLILVIAVVILLILYITKLANSPEQVLRRSIRNYAKQETKVEPMRAGTQTKRQYGYTECPRGFGNIKKLSYDGSVSDRCLGCYRIMECYGESEIDDF